MIRTEVLEITPELAATVLSRNGRNRSLSKNRVNQLAGAMRRGEFMGLNGETIKLDEEGHLEDGQHRLAAIVASGMSQQIIVVRGVDRHAQETIDIGRARTFSDMLAIRGEEYANVLAAATRMVWAYERSGIPLNKGLGAYPTPQELFACLDRHPDLRGSLHAGGHYNGILVLPRSVVVGLHFLFASADTEDADEFFTRLGDGDGLAKGHPIFALRDRFIRALDATDKMRDIVKLAFTIRAWNAWRAGEEITKLQWKPGGARPDRFPVIDGCQIKRIDPDENGGVEPAPDGMRP